MERPVRRLIHRDFNSVDETMNFLNVNLLKYHDENTYSDTEIEIDFSHCTVVEPYHLAPLACVIYEYQQKGYIISVAGMNPRLKKYFEESGFMDFCTGDYQESTFPIPKDKNTLPLWRIVEGAHNTYPKEAEKYFETHNFRGKDLQPLYTALGEMMNNVFDHSNCSIPGFSITQFHPRQKLLYTCVCDLGCTIPFSVNQYLKEEGLQELSATDALLEAVKLNFSTYSRPHNRGRGLDTLVSLVNEANGTFILASGPAAIRKAGDEEFELFNLEDNFPGTMVVIELNSLSLLKKEEEMTDDLHIL